MPAVPTLEPQRPQVAVEDDGGDDQHEQRADAVDRAHPALGAGEEDLNGAEECKQEAPADVDPGQPGDERGDEHDELEVVHQPAAVAMGVERVGAEELPRGQVDLHEHAEDDEEGSDEVDPVEDTPKGLHGAYLYITGRTGYLGSELARLRPDASTERVEIRAARAVRELLERLRPDVVIHTAYRQEDASVNVQGAENVARAAAAVGARLVHLSTDVVFDGRKGRPYAEDDPLSPVTDYGRAKAEAEARVAAAHPAALVVRTSLLYGGAEPSQHELAACDPSSTFFTNELRSPVRVTDLAHALLELAALDVAGPLHVAGADGVSRAEFAELLSGGPVRTAPAPATRPLDCRLDSSRARAMIRTRLRGVREVLDV